MSDTTRNDDMGDYTPLSQACIKALTDRIEEKRKLAASEVEKMVVEFSIANNFTMINRLIIVLGRKFCLSPNPNTRKGGLLGLAAVIVGFKNGSPDADPPPELVDEVVNPILTCFLDADSRVRYYACESLYNVSKVAESNIIPNLEVIFDNMSKVVADPDLGVRGGAELLDRLLKDIVSEQTTYDIQNYMPKFEEYIYTKNPFTRLFIISWIRLLDSKIDMVNQLPRLLDGMFNCLYDQNEEIRASTRNLLSEFLDKIATSPTFKVNIPPMISTILKHIRTDKENLVQSTAIAWLKQFVGLMDSQDLTNFTPGILAALLPCLSDRSDIVVRNSLRVIADIFCFDTEIDQQVSNESHDDDISSTKDDEPAETDRRKSAFRSPSQQRLAGSTKKVSIGTVDKAPIQPTNVANVNRFIQALYKTFRDKDSVFEERGTFIILNICNMKIGPDVIYKSFAEILRDEKTSLKFAYNMVQKLNRILLTTHPMHELRSRLSTDEDSEGLFQTLFYAWSHSPISALTLCLVSNNYRLASEIVIALSHNEVNIELLTQVDWVVQLIESPVFATLRMKLLDVNNNQYLLQTLYGLLMILPQSEAYKKLSHRLDQAHKFLVAQPQMRKPTSVATTTKKSNYASHESLMKHFHNIQATRKSQSIL